MKELIMEQKAQNYKVYTELINRLEDVKDAIKKQNYRIAMDILCKPYPYFQVTTHSELKESENSDDEKIRKSIIEHLEYLGKYCSESMPDVDKWIAWLEKQGEQKLIDSLTQQESMDIAVVKCFDEQKPVDKIKPKFKAGDWIVQENTVVYKVIKVCKSWYEIVDNKDKRYSIGFYKEYMFHPWTIQDANNGDALSDGTTIFIFKDLLSDGSVMSYCDYDANSGESDAFCPLPMNLTCSKITPATKEQRDTLMKAMADAGYTFDFEKKELKKIEQKSAKWNEDDERTLNSIIWHLRYSVNNGGIEHSADQLEYWLKSFKDRYTLKPSEEQIKVCKEVYADILSAKGFDLGTINSELNRLEEELKKLRDE